jgi:hypothetical protein
MDSTHLIEKAVNLFGNFANSLISTGHFSLDKLLESQLGDAQVRELYAILTNIHNVILDIENRIEELNKPDPQKIQMYIERLNERYTPTVVSIQKEIRKYNTIDTEQVFKLTHQYYYQLVQFNHVLHQLALKWRDLRTAVKVDVKKQLISDMF